MRNVGRAGVRCYLDRGIKVILGSRLNMAVAAGSQVSGLLSCSWLQLSQPMSRGGNGEEGEACLWKTLTYFVALPRMGVSMLNVFLKLHHREKRPEFTAYPFQVLSLGR